MTTLVTCAVAEQLKPRLPELLQRVLDWRVQEGFNKYGQTLADNPDTLPEQLVHLAQELLDVAMYGTWIQRRPELPMQTQVAVGIWTTMAVRFLAQLLDLAPELTFEDLIRKEGHSGVPAAIQTVRELERVILGAYPVTVCYVGPVQALHLLLREREQAQARVKELEAQLASYTAALTPSTETKAAYMGEFYQEVERCNPEWGEDREEPEFLTERVMIDWDIIKQIMGAAHARAQMQAGRP